MHDAPLEVDIAPAQRAQLAEAQSGVGGRQDQRGVLGVRRRARGELVVGQPALGRRVVRALAKRARKQLDLVAGQDAKLRRAAHGLALDAGGHVDGEPVVALRALEDPVDDDEVLVDRPRGEATLVDVMGAKRVDHLARELGEGQLTERRRQHLVDRLAVVAQRVGPALAIDLEVAQRLRLHHQGAPRAGLRRPRDRGPHDGHGRGLEAHPA